MSERRVLVTGTVFILPAQAGGRFGHFPPFNRHYLEDLGAFLLPLGLALVWAARDPAGHRSLIALRALPPL